MKNSFKIFFFRVTWAFRLIPQQRKLFHLRRGLEISPNLKMAWTKFFLPNHSWLRSRRSIDLFRQGTKIVFLWTGSSVRSSFEREELIRSDCGKKKGLTVSSTWRENTALSRSLRGQKRKIITVKKKRSFFSLTFLANMFSSCVFPFCIPRLSARPLSLLLAENFGSNVWKISYREKGKGEKGCSASCVAVVLQKCRSSWYAIPTIARAAFCLILKLNAVQRSAFVNLVYIPFCACFYLLIC